MKRLSISPIAAALLLERAVGEEGDEGGGAGDGDDLDELAARLRALVRRSKGEPAAVLHIGRVVLDPASRAVSLGGQVIDLAPREFALLQELMLNAGRVLSREQLEERMYRWGDEVESNAVEVHVHHLRRKLGPQVVKTIRGVGYMMPRGEHA